MSLPEFSIHRPVTVLMGTLILLLLGGIALVRLPVDLMPETEFPMISVRAEYPGVAPEEMENLVARPLEQAFAAAPGVQEILTTSSEGSANVRVSFAFGTNLDEAANELRIRLDRRRRTLPEDMEPPTLYKFDTSQFPIMFLTVASTNMGPKELRYFVEKSLQYRLERVPGVAQFGLRGGLRREIHVDLNLEKLRALDLSLAEVSRLLRMENLNRPVGPVQEGNYEILLRTQGEFQNLEQIRSLVLTTRRGVPVYLRDIATVEDSHEEVRQLVSVNGNPAVRVFINKQSGSNTVAVCDAVREEVERINRDYPNILVTPTMDNSEYIKAAINNVKTSAVQGSALAVLILLFFLRSFSSTLIIGVAIPISVIGTFVLMYGYGFTLNTVSFGGLALGVGMLVDNAIVVLENIFRHREKGKGRIEAAVLGSKQVALPIVAATLTTVAVFVPVLFTRGMTAQTFKQLAYVVSFSLLCSLVMALTLVPVLCSRFLRAGSDVKRPAGPAGVLYDTAGRLTEGMNNQYRRILEWSIRHRATVVLAALVLFGGSMTIAPLVGVELMPEADEGEINVDVELEPGTRVEVTHALMRRLEQITREHVPEVAAIMVESGSGGPMRGGGATNAAEMRIKLVGRAERDRTASQIVNDLRPRLSIQPGMVIRTRVFTGMSRRMTKTSNNNAGDRLSVEIRGYDLAILNDLAQQVAKVMSTIPGVPEVQVGRRPGQPEMLLTVDRLKASTMGLNVSDIAEAMETAVGGRRTSMYRQEGDEFNILVRLQERDRLKLAQVAQIPLATPLGQTVPAETVVRMRRQEGPVSIDRANQERIIAVSGALGDRDLGSVVRDLDTKLREIPRPNGYEFQYGGEYLEQQRTFRELLFAAILALILVYMVMASQFESLRDPFIILFSIPLASVGVISTLVLTNTTFNMQGFLGVIILVGIVVNNAIVLIDYMNQLRREHAYSLRDAVLLGATRRLRPILMTTTTTVLALIPMAMGLGEGGEMQAPMARVIIGGLTTSALITLVLIPVVYMLFEERTEKVRVREAATAGIGPLPAPSGSQGD